MEAGDSIVPGLPSPGGCAIHDGDPCLYGALPEQTAGWRCGLGRGGGGWSECLFRPPPLPCRPKLTIPGLVQTIVLQPALSGRTGVPEARVAGAARGPARLALPSTSVARHVEGGAGGLLPHYPPEKPLWRIGYRVQLARQWLQAACRCGRWLPPSRGAPNLIRTTLYGVSPGACSPHPGARSKLFRQSRDHLFARPATGLLL